MTSPSNSPRWCKSKCEGTACDGGSAGTYTKRAYALAVAIELNGDSICHCGAAISLFSGEVDRTVSGCYRPGYVVMTCHDCNNDRTHVSGFDAIAFEAAVLRASLKVSIPKPADAKREWLKGRDIGKSLRQSRFMKN